MPHNHDNAGQHHDHLPLGSLVVAGDVRAFHPALAASIGLNEAIVLQQLHYWLARTDHVRDGRRWVYNRYEDWHIQFPWCSTATIRRTFASLERQGLVIAASYNRSAMDHTRWYTIDYDALEALVATILVDQGVAASDTSAPEAPPSDSPCADRAAQIEPIGRADCPHRLLNVSGTVLETTSETTQRDSVRPPARATPAETVIAATPPIPAHLAVVPRVEAMPGLPLPPAATLTAAVGAAGLTADPYLRGATLLGWLAPPGRPDQSVAEVVIATPSALPAVVASRLRPRLAAGLSAIIGQPVGCALVTAGVVGAAADRAALTLSA